MRKHLQLITSGRGESVVEFMLQSLYNAQERFCCSECHRNVNIIYKSCVSKTIMCSKVDIPRVRQILILHITLLTSIESNIIMSDLRRNQTLSGLRSQQSSWMFQQIKVLKFCLGVKIQTLKILLKQNTFS